MEKNSDRKMQLCLVLFFDCVQIIINANITCEKISKHVFNTPNLMFVLESKYIFATKWRQIIYFHILSKVQKHFVQFHRCLF